MATESSTNLQVGNLLLYRRRPARLLKIGERLEIETQGGEQLRVRAKDVELLHPGPLNSFSQLSPQQGDLELAWQILTESTEPHSLQAVAELIFGSYNPATAWAVCELVQDGLYFRSTTGGIQARTPSEVAHEIALRQARVEEARAWEEFLERARQGKVHPENDASYLRETEDLALERRRDSRLLSALGLSEHPETAHKMLLDWGYWNSTGNPYPVRLGLPTQSPSLPPQELPDEPRLDLTHLPAYAIDDRGNQDPDDALSLGNFQIAPDGSFLRGRFWVHVADAAALAPPNSPLDLEARMRGATLYLPEGAVSMLPQGAISQLGLGLSEVSPALSFEIELDALGQVSPIQIQASWVRVQRYSYEEVETLMDQRPFQEFHRLASIYQARRQRNRAITFDLPEVIIRLVQGEIVIQPVVRSRSRDLVREAMLMAGEAVAQFVQDRGIPFPYTVQNEPDLPLEYQKDFESAQRMDLLSSRYAIRRFLKRSQLSSFASPHAGLGLPGYCRLTSPLRRYADLLAHQQLRAHLGGQRILSTDEILERGGAAETAAGSISQAEALSRRHWTLVYLQQHPGWRGTGVLVEKSGLRGTVIIPELALEIPLHLREETPLDASVPLVLSGINLAELQAHFSPL